MIEKTCLKKKILNIGVFLIFFLISFNVLPRMQFK